MRTLRSLAPLAAATVGAVAAVTIAIAAVARRRDAHLVRTAAGPALIYTVRDDAGEPVRVLRLGGVFQSATYLGERRFEPVFEYYRSFDIAFDIEPVKLEQTRRGVERALMLGGGGYAWPKHVLTQREDVQMDVVEIDPAVTRAAWQWFFLDELVVRARGRLGLIAADGRSFLEQPSAPYDVIVNDTFVGREPVYALATVEAARAVRERLTLGGIYLANVVSQREGADLSFLRDTVATLSEVFVHVQVLCTSDACFGGEDNYLVVASDILYELPSAIPFDEDFLGSPLRDAG